MNAGGSYGCIADCLETIQCCTMNGELLSYHRSELEFSYRQSNLPECIILSATFNLEPSDPVAVRKRVLENASVDEVEHLVRDGSYQLYRRRDGSIELYDLERDRGEREDLASERTAVRARLQALVDDWLERERGLRNSVAAGERRPLPTEAVEQLRDLGYVE